jgi:hypothetical protein
MRVLRNRVQLNGGRQRLANSDFFLHSDRRNLLALHVGHDWSRGLRRQTNRAADAGANYCANRPANRATDHRAANGAASGRGLAKRYGRGKSKNGYGCK